MSTLESTAKRRLLTERAQVVAELGHLHDLIHAEVDVDLDEADAGIVEREKDAALIAILEHKLQDLDAALRALEAGRYGICGRCSRPIEVQRLEAKPDTIFCVQCQQEVERSLHRR